MTDEKRKARERLKRRRRSSIAAPTYSGPSTRSSFLSGRIDSRFENNLWRFITVYEDIGANFNPEVGFIERNALHQYFGQLAYKPRPRFIPHVRQMEFETQIEYYADRQNKLATKQIELSWDTQFKNSSEIFFRPIENVPDVLNTPFQIRPGIIIPVGAYHFNRPQVSFIAIAARSSFWRGDTSGVISIRERETRFQAELPSDQPHIFYSTSLITLITFDYRRETSRPTSLLED